MSFWGLIRSILLVALCVHPVVLGVAGLALFLTEDGVDGLFAVAATPMTLAFFGLPVLTGSLFVIVPTYYALSRYGRREKVPVAVFAIGAGSLAYLIAADPAPTGAMPGYDQEAHGFVAASLITWALYAYFRLDLRQG
ncbi:MAG: hypothetical protein ABR538_10970 [Candidatus Binatia bacterium]